MIAALIRRSIDNRALVLLGVAALALWGIWSMLRTPLDALPDLSDVQVIIRTPYPGQAPELVIAAHGDRPGPASGGAGLSARPARALRTPRRRGWGSGVP